MPTTVATCGGGWRCLRDRQLVANEPAAAAGDDGFELHLLQRRFGFGVLCDWSIVWRLAGRRITSEVLRFPFRSLPLWSGLFAGMLIRTHVRDARASLVRATTGVLPFYPGSFDLIFCVNAIHHFGRTEQFIAEARRLLRAGGTLAVIGMDPHHGHDYWCVYDYFPETKAKDLARYPSSGQMIDVMLRAGFERVDCRAACRSPRLGGDAACLKTPSCKGGDARRRRC